MIRNISIGIDAGSSTIRVVVGEFIKGEKNPKIIGFGEAPSQGIRHGYITSFDEAATAIKSAVQMAEKMSGIKIRRAFISIGGSTLKSETAYGEATISKADGEVTKLDVNKTIEDAENNLKLGNKKVIQMFPVSFKLDGREVLGRVEGMQGVKLEAKILFITSSSQHLEDMLAVMAEAGVEPIDIIVPPIAGNHVVLSERQKIIGCALVNMGAETTSIGVFENGSLISLHTLNIGSSDITNDIALGLKIPLEKAEELKITNDAGEYSKKKLEEIIEARLSDIFEGIGNHLKKIKRNELLPAGIVWIGGGALITNLEELSKNELKLPAKIGSAEMLANTKTKMRDPAWFVALGLILSKKDGEGYSEGSFPNLFKDLKRNIKSFAKQLMP